MEGGIAGTEARHPAGRWLALERVLLGAALLGVQVLAAGMRSTDEAGAMALAVFYVPILATAETFLARGHRAGTSGRMMAVAGMALSAVIFFGAALAAFLWAGHWAVAGAIGFASSYAALPGVRLYTGRWR